MSLKQFSLLFGAVAIVELIAEKLGTPLFIYLSKPLVMPLLAGLYISRVELTNSLFHKFMLSGFLFSWLGDISLMLESTSEQFFIIGLVSFLIAHIFYILAFGKNVNNSPNPSFLKKTPLAGLPFVIFHGFLLFFLIPALNEMLVPVICYATVLTIMVLAALNRYQAAPPDSVTFIFTGSLLFMISDSLIAIDKFLMPIDRAQLLIMALYIGAQYFITIGGIRYQPQGKISET